MRRLLLALALLAGCGGGHVPPGPLPTPTPVITPTPSPTPAPVSTPFPVPPVKPPPPHLALKPGPGPCTGGGGRQCGGEPNCAWHDALWAQMRGIARYGPMGVLDHTPEDVFTGGGSENTPVTAHAAQLYFDPAKAVPWFTRYFEMQADGEFPWGGKEIWSGLYFGYTSSNVAVVHEWARTHGQPKLYALSGRWLQAYSAVLALVALQDTTQTKRAWQHVEARPKGDDGLDPYGPPVGRARQVEATRDASGDTFNSWPSGDKGGYSVAMVANRAYINSYPDAVWFQGWWLSMALNHPTRPQTGNIDQAEYTGLCGFYLAAGYPWDAKGRVSMGSWTPAPEVFGLDADSRFTLQQFVASGGTRGLSAVLGYLDGLTLACNWTVIRGSRGITAAFMTPDGQPTAQCSGSKGGTYTAATLDWLAGSGLTLTSLGRAARMNAPSPTSTWQQAGEIWESSAGLTSRGIDMVSDWGNPVYTTFWPRGGHIEEVH